MDSDVNRGIVERFDAMLNTGDLTELDELCSPDMVNHALAPHRPKRLEGMRPVAVD
jgi:ketosteroid isomerase-like protein